MRQPNLEARLLARANRPKIYHDDYGNSWATGGAGVIHDPLSHEAWEALRTMRKQLETIRETAIRRMDMRMVKQIDATLLKGE